MSLAFGDALTILGIIGSFIGAVVVVAVTVGGERKRIDALEKTAEVSKVDRDVLRSRLDEVSTKVAVLQQSDIRYQRDHEALQATLASLTEQVHAIALSNARIEAALKKE